MHDAARQSDGARTSLGAASSAPSHAAFGQRPRHAEVVALAIVGADLDESLQDGLAVDVHGGVDARATSAHQGNAEVRRLPQGGAPAQWLAWCGNPCPA